MRRSVQLSLVAALTLLSTPVTADARSESDSLHDRIEHIAHEVVGGSTAGMAVSVVDGSRIELLRAWGHADDDGERPLGPDSRLPVASVSKVVTSLTALTLHEEGTLDLDAPIERSSGVRLRDERATVDRTPLTGRHLLTHHGGLAESTLMPPSVDDGDLDRPLSDWLERHPPVPGHPAIGMHYSPLVGYALLGAAIENATGTDFDHAARRAVLDPVGADSATFEESTDPDDAVIVAATDGGFEATPWPRVPETPSASLRWSARDSAALLSALTVRDGALPERVVEEARTTSVRPHHGGGGHTQVFFEDHRRGVRVLEHPGANGVAWLAIVPEADVGVFVAVTSHETAAMEATDAVVDAVVDWTIDAGRAQPAPAAPAPAIIPGWLPSSRPAIPTGTFQERLFTGHGPEKALRSLLGQVRVTADGHDLLMKGRRLSPEGEGRWCDQAGCVAGRISDSGITVLERGDRGMLEQTLTPASTWDDQRTIVAALAAWGLVVLTIAIRAVWRLVRGIRGRAQGHSLAPGIAVSWAASTTATLVAVVMVPLGPLLWGSSSAATPHAAALWSLTALATTTVALALAWVITSVRRWRTVSTRHVVAAGMCAALALPMQIYLVDWGVTLPG
ncbi:serine hydrolase domain-containing protein [Dietzia natronolimnaea]|nr:serine hydrolase domain-containing protein [Dietzia natronolimnaea]